MSRQSENMWEALSQASLVEGPCPEMRSLESPWYVKVLLAFSGWLAAVFLLGFIGVGLHFVVENGFFSLLTGGLMIGGAYVILRIPKNEFVEHLALAISLAGQALLVWAIYDLTKASDEIVLLLVAFLELILALIIPHFIHRVFSSYIAAVASAMALTAMGIPSVVSGVVMLLASLLWLNEFHFPKCMGEIRAIGYGLVLALIQLKGSVLFGGAALWWRSSHSLSNSWGQPWIGEILAGTVLLFVVWQLLYRNRKAINKGFMVTVFLGTLLLCAASMKAPGITAGMMIMLLGFAGSNRVLLGLGIASLLFNISSYYYTLDATLLIKSEALFVIGLVLLTARWCVGRLAVEGKEVENVE